MKTPFELGKEAFLNGKSYQANPFPYRGSEERDEWFEGFDACDVETSVLPFPKKNDEGNEI
jgi:hypothetical protein